MGDDIIPILIVSDCEPDARETVPGEPTPWRGFERYFAYLAQARARLAQATGAEAHFSWFWRLDPQIALTYGSAGWAVRQYAEQIAQARAAGDEIGAHTHPWRWDGGVRRWIADFGNPEWVEKCVRDALAEFERAFGMPCRLFSFGDGWHSQASVALLERLGIRLDLTLEPGCEAATGLVAQERSTGILPDRRNAPRHPYRPSAEHFLEPGGNGALWLLPMSTAPVPAMGRPKTEKLNLGHDSVQFGAMFDAALSRGASTRPYVAIAVRTDVGDDEYLMRCVRQNLDSILDHEQAGRFAFVTPTEALTMLEPAAEGAA